MAFYSSDLKLAELFANPTVSQIYTPTQGGMLGGKAGQRGLATAGQQSLSTTGTRGYTSPVSTNLQSIVDQLNLTSGISGSDISGGMISGSGTDTGTPITVDDTLPSATDSWTGTPDFFGDTGVTGGAEINLRDYLENRDLYQFGLGMLGIPGLGALVDYKAGINPTPFGPTVLDSFGEEAGITEDYLGGESWEDLDASTQRDMLVEQLMFDDVGSWYDSLIPDFLQDDDDISLDYDPDLDLTIGDWQETTPMTEEQLAEHQAIMDAPDVWSPGTVETVVEDQQGTITPVVEEGTYMDTTITTGDGDYSFDSDSGWDSAEDFTEDTGLGDSDWDTSHDDFSWDTNDSSDSGSDDFGDWDSDAESDMDEDSGWSGADSDFDDSGSDDGGGDSGGGGGGSYIATAATQALGEDGLKLFEDWRDYMFTALPTFTTSYGRYRVTAPKIVAEIDKKENSKDIYSWIWDMHLKPIYDLIKQDKDSDKALKDYKAMVKDLQNKFLTKEKV